jgi:hypothetical protein
MCHADDRIVPLSMKLVFFYIGQLRLLTFSLNSWSYAKINHTPVNTFISARQSS